MTKIDNLTETLNKLVDQLKTDLSAALKGNKSAARRARKATLELAATGKEYRKESVTAIG